MEAESNVPSDSQLPVPSTSAASDSLVSAVPEPTAADSAEESPSIPVEALDTPDLAAPAAQPAELPPADNEVPSRQTTPYTQPSTPMMDTAQSTAPPSVSETSAPDSSSLSVDPVPASDPTIQATAPLQFGSSDPPQIHAPTAVAPHRPAAVLASTPIIHQSPGRTPSTQPIPSKTEQLRQRVQEMPEDGEAWQELVHEAERKGDLERTRQVYEDFLRHFPDAGKVWVAYADLELRHSLFPRVEAIFARCLRNSTSVDLWAFYITYIRRMNKTEGVDPDKAKQSRNTIVKSYDFCLAHVGHDRLAGQLWNDYIIFLRSSESSGVWEAQQNMDNVRKAYQRAVAIPLNNVEQIWSEYNHWEQQLNKLTAKKFIGERGAAYMTARAVLRELTNLTENISSTDLPRRPDWSNPEDRRSLAAWQKYLQWEESNPLQLDDEVSQLQPRVMFAYRRAFAQARFLPTIWFMGANYAKRINKPDDALKFLEAGQAANNTSLLLSFALAENYESRRNLSACYRIYDGLVDDIQKALLASEAARDSRIEAAVQQAKAALVAQQSTNGGVDDNVHGDDEDQSTLAEEIVQIKDEISAQAQVGIDELKRSLASVWIAEMRFARRSEGIKQARTVFSKARKAPNLTWQVVEANAMMEYHWNKEPKVATNVFELGLKTFSENVDYVMRYLDFLISTNDDTNARAVVERTISKVSTEAALPLWKKWFRYESSYSDLAAIQKMDARLGEAYPQTSPLQRFVDRHCSLGLDSMVHQDLGIIPGIDVGYVGQDSTMPADLRSSTASPRVGERRGRSASPAVYERRPADGKRQRRDSPSPPRRGQAPSTQVPQIPTGPANSATQPMPTGMLAPQPYSDQTAPGKAAYNPPVRRAAMPHSGQQPIGMAPIPQGPSVIPDALLYFMSILPSPQSFNGAVLPPQDVIEAMGIASLPAPRVVPTQVRPGAIAYDRRGMASPVPGPPVYAQRPMYR